MIETIADLELDLIDEIEMVNNKILEKLGISIQEMKDALSSYVSNSGSELLTEFVNIAPLGDYSKMLESNDQMEDFLKVEAHKPEHWVLSGIRTTDQDKKLLTFKFDNDSVDDGDIFKGYVYVSFDGKIKHAFAQVE